MQPREPRSRLRRLGLVLSLLMLTSVLSGFTGNVGQEAEFYAGVGIGQVDTRFDSDRYGEIGGVFRFKFRNFPYDDLAAWIQVGASWTTYPTGGNYGNQILSIQYLGGIKKNFGEFGGGFVLSGDTTGTGPLLVFPCFRMLLGKEDKAMFGFGVLDEVPLYAISNAMHMEGIFAIPSTGALRPWVKLGTRLNLYVPGERFPLEFAAGLELRIKKQFKIMLDGSIGDGGAISTGGNQPAGDLAPSFSLALRLGGALGDGVTSDRRPLPAE